MPGPASLFLALALPLLAACGAGSGAGASTGNQPATTTRLVLGTRSLPGGTVTVSAAERPSGGGATALTISCSGDAAPVAAELLLGGGYDDAVPIALAAIPGGWSASLASPPADAQLLVRVTFADGGIVESAAGDFPIPP